MPQQNVQGYQQLLFRVAARFARALEENENVSGSDRIFREEIANNNQVGLSDKLSYDKT